MRSTASRALQVRALSGISGPDLILEQSDLIGLFAELIRTKLFSYDDYARYLIATDALGKQDLVRS